MKFSEAWVLGSTMIKFNAHLFLSCGKGCLRGTAYFAATGKRVMGPGDDIAVWPWLNNKFACPIPYPFSECLGTATEAAYIINGLAYAVERGEWTIEQALDWIRANEPSEPSEPVLEAVNAERSLV
jgi:hypothetical protein